MSCWAAGTPSPIVELPGYGVIRPLSAQCRRLRSRRASTRRPSSRRQVRCCFAIHCADTIGAGVAVLRSDGTRNWGLEEGRYGCLNVRVPSPPMAAPAYQGPVVTR
jgi:hypothetical protein